MFADSPRLCKEPASAMFPSGAVQQAAFGGCDGFARFTMVRELGRGAFSVVFLACDARRGGIDVALKAVKLPADDFLRSGLLREVEVLRRLDHPNCTRLLESFERTEGVLLHLVLPLLHGGTLRRLLDARGALHDDDVARCGLQLFAALEYLHTTARVVHRDLKPENLMASEALPAAAGAPLPHGLLWILVDFGSAIFINEGASIGGTPGQPPQASIGGTVGYLSPEVERILVTIESGQSIKPAEAAALGSPTLDVFAAGRTLQFALTGVHPSSSFTFASKRTCRRLEKLGAPARELLAACTAEDPARRPTAGAATVRAWLEELMVSSARLSESPRSPGSLFSPFSSSTRGALQHASAVPAAGADGRDALIVGFPASSSTR